MASAQPDRIAARLQPRQPLPLGQALRPRLDPLDTEHRCTRLELELVAISFTMNDAGKKRVRCFRKTHFAQRMMTVQLARCAVVDSALGAMGTTTAGWPGALQSTLG